MVSRFDFFESAETILERELAKNPHYPFKVLCTDKNGNSIYVYSRRLSQFYFALIGSVASILGLSVWLLIGANPVQSIEAFGTALHQCLVLIQSYALFGVLMFVVSCYLCMEYHQLCSIIFDPASSTYSIYSNKTHVVTQHCHNIYIRMHSKRTGKTHWPLLQGTQSSSRFVCM